MLKYGEFSKVSIRPFKPKDALQYLFVHESHLHNHVYFNVSHIHAAANSCADACMHVLHRETHAPPALGRSVGTLTLPIARMTSKHVTNDGRTFTQEREWFLMK